MNIINFFLNSESFSFNLDPQKEIFLPGIKKFYTEFKKLAERKALRPNNEPIYSISEEGEASFYDNIDINSFGEIYGDRKVNGITKYDIINANTIQFRVHLGIPYKVNNYQDLINEMKNNKGIVNCLFIQYDKNIGVASAGSTYFKF